MGAPVSFIEISEIVRQRMTIRTDKLEVFFGVIESIAVGVVYFERNSLRQRMPLVPTAKTAFFAEFF